MEILESIKKGFAYLDPGRSERIAIDERHWFHIFRWDKEYGVGLECPEDCDISERFATARFHSATINIEENRETRFLLLSNSVESLRNEFAFVCANFVDPGPDGSARHEILLHPDAWWKNWQQLMGNSIQERMPHSIIGELLVLLKMIERGDTTIRWTASSHSTHDLEGDHADYEVKTTLSRYDSIISISGQFQLLPKHGRSLFLAFCRLEKTESGDLSINSLIETCRNLNCDIDYMEAELEKLGYEHGRTARKEWYRLLDPVLVFPVDDHFPKIIPESFLSGTLPTGIVSIKYDVDLSSLIGEGL